MTVDPLLRQIASDNRSGAAELLERSVELFDRLQAQASEFATASQARRAVIEASVGLIRAQPCMATLINLAGTVLRASSSATTSDELLKSGARAAHVFDDGCRLAVFAAASELAGFVGDGKTILTHSRSSTILHALSGARAVGKNFEVIVTESRPMREGLTLAEELASKDITVTLIADAAVASVMHQVSYVLVGADLISPGTLVNKIGTRMIALAARERGVPIYAVADSSKFINPLTLKLPPEPKREPDELWPGAPFNVAVMNRYFEETPLAFFTGLITEGGSVTPEAVDRLTQAAPVESALVEALS